MRSKKGTVAKNESHVVELVSVIVYDVATVVKIVSLIVEVLHNWSSG